MPEPTEIMPATEANGKKREERRRIVPRGEGLSSDKSTGLRSLRQTCGRFSVRGPAAWRVDGGTEKKRITGFAKCKELPNRWYRIRRGHNWTFFEWQASRLVYFLETATPLNLAIQVVTKDLFLRQEGEKAPYDADKQNVNGRAQLGGA